MASKTLLLTVGLPRSGKTTWAISTGFPIVNPDSIRLAIHGKPFLATAEPSVWITAKVMVRALFMAGHDTVILDATNTTRERRDEWKSNEWESRFKVIDTDWDTCLERARQEGNEEIVGVIERMAGQYEPLQDDEAIYPEELVEFEAYLHKVMDSIKRWGDAVRAMEAREKLREEEGHV